MSIFLHICPIADIIFYILASLLLLLLLVTARRLLTMRLVWRPVHALEDDADPHPRLVESALYCTLERQIL